MDEQADTDVTTAAAAAQRDAGAASSDDDDLGAALLAGLPGGGTADGTDGDDSEADDSGLIEYEAGLSHQLDTTVPPEPVPVVTGNEIDFNLDTGAAGGGATDGAGLDAVASAAVDAGAEDGSAGLAERDRAFNLDFEAVGGDKDLDNFFEGLDTLDAAEEEPHDASLDGQEDVGTKLDLAKAFIEMGDQDGAKEVLKEVMDAGDDDQKREAQGLLRTLEADA